ncbi:pseudouridine synthase [Marinobacterium sp. D7]|uniref:16S rRNA pseudouridine(516) synthase n=1 Tax=Marinobacterium ramblicola TaxID=2849041 RepID=UPI001C2D329D|nr:pseudouridine synthase [Marinobacterium ramblicola]MBV1790101.1 pseudouridine synthase [Marinobacterium ramblicola]
MRLDKFICKHTPYSHQRSRWLIANGRVRVAGRVVRDSRAWVDRFVSVWLDDEQLQGRPAHYLMLNKPRGYLSATEDPQHPTVLELLPRELHPELHIGGRLDRSTSGLLILTNDGLWSRRLTEPKQKVPKVYRVVTLEPITPETAQRFAEGIYLAYEGLTTSPAQLQLLGEREARLTIYEGRYHQVKRMFAQVGNRVTALHRESMGGIALDPLLSPGEYRTLTEAEIASVSA